MEKIKKNVLKLIILKQINITSVLVIGIFLTLVSGCNKGIDNPEPQKDYMEYGNVVKEGLIAYYPFNGNAKDYSGNVFNGVENGTSASVGRFNQQVGALQFNGVDNYIEIPNFSNVIGDSGTICFWIRTPDSLNQNRNAAIISKIDSNGFGYILSVYGVHDFWFNYKLQNLKVEEYMYTNYSVAGEYLFLAVTFSNKKLSYYFQGYPTLEDTFKVGEFRFNDNNQPLFIGKSLNSQYKFFEGEIDDLLIYNRALSKDEILKLYNWK